MKASNQKKQSYPSPKPYYTSTDARGSSTFKGPTASMMSSSALKKASQNKKPDPMNSASSRNSYDPGYHPKRTTQIKIFFGYDDSNPSLEDSANKWLKGKFKSDPGFSTLNINLINIGTRNRFALIITYVTGDPDRE